MRSWETLRHGGDTRGEVHRPCRLRTSSRRRAIALVCGLALATILGLGLAPAAQAANPDPVQYFYVPFPEDQLLAALVAIQPGNGGSIPNPVSPVTTYITITTVANGTIIYYDQWENGYDTDIANPINLYSATNLGGTQIWGDGNTANGAPPGLSSDLINSGTVILLNNAVNTSTLQTVIDFDGRDKFAATKTIAVTRSGWATGSSTLFAGCVEVFDTNNWGTDYRAPVGVDIPDGTDYQLFEYTALAISAGEEGATISVDADNDGDYADAGDLSGVTLAQGETRFVTSVEVGGHVVSDKPVQVDIFSGDVGSNYESRDSALLPTNLWSSSYYTPVSTVSSVTQGSTTYNGLDTTVWLYNPGTSSITVTYVRRVSGTLTTSTFSVTTGGYYRQVVPSGTGAHFYTTGGEQFYAYSTTDSNNSTYSSNQGWDWSFTLIPQTSLTTQALVGLGLGRDPLSTTNPAENGNPIWVTPVGNGNTYTTVYVDYDADPATGLLTDPNGNKYDVSYSLRELDQAKIYAPALAVDATSTGETTDGTTASSLTISHTTGTGTNRLMIVGVAIANDTTTQAYVTGVTYGGTALTYVGSVMAAAGGGNGSRPRTELWALASPTSGTANVVVTLGATRSFSAGVTTFNWADISNGLTSALGVYASNSATSGATASVTATTTTGDWVYEVTGAENIGTTTPGALSVPTTQTRRWTQSSRSGDSSPRRLRAAGSTGVSIGTSLTLTETQSGTSYPWAISAVAIKPYQVDQTGMLVYTLPSGGVYYKLAVAWGQDPLTATAGAPGLDVGTSVPPMPEFTDGKNGSLYDDNDGDGYISPGDELEYTIDVYNISRLPVPDVIVRDVVPPGTDYVPGTTYKGATQIPDNGAPGTPFPLDNDGTYDGSNVGTLPINGSFTVTFHAIIKSYENLAGAVSIYNGGSGYALGITLPVRDTAKLRGRISDFVWFDEDGDGVQDAGEDGVAGVTVRLLDSAGNPALNDQGIAITAETDENGIYDFKGLLAGSYIVEFVAPEGAEFTTPNVGDDSTDSDADQTTGRTAVNVLGGGQRIVTADAGLGLIIPTAAVISSFKASVMEGKVVIQWETAHEAGTAGFNVQRLEANGGRWVTVNERLIPALFESPGGGSYCLVDRGAEPYTPLTYQLVEVETSGKLRTYGPYEVTAGAALSPGQASSQIASGEELVRIPKVTRLGDAPFWGLPPQPVPPGPAGVDRLRIEVETPGLYRIEAADIATGLGRSEAQVRELISTKGLNLTSQGRTVSWFPAADNSALFFYGQALDSIYASRNVYWLTLGRGTVMTNVMTRSAPSTETTTFTDSVHFEENLFDVAALSHDPESDYWLWQYLVAGHAGLGTAKITLDAPGALQGVQLDVLLQGLMTTGQADEHHARILLNGTTLGDTWWTGTVAHQVSFAIPAGVLNPGANQVEVQALLDGAWDSIIGLDSFDLTYQRSTTVVDDQLLLTSAVTGPVRVDGLSSAAAWVLDLADPSAPQLLVPTGSGGDPGSAWVAFSAVSGRQYLVATAIGALRPVAITAASAPTLRTAGRAGNYVVITAPALLDAATRLAAYRASQGMKTVVATTTEIYDEFNYGIPNPHAIQSYLTYVLWGRNSGSRYVVLAGEGSYDYKDYMGYGDSLVPPLMADTDSGLAPSDVMLADVYGQDGVPDLAIGRIPALTEADLDAALGKIQAYEAAAAGAWRQSVVLVADNPDEGGDFTSDSNLLAASLPSSFLVTKAYLAELSPAEAQARLLAGLTGGALLVNYVGHANVDQLAEEALLATADVAGLAASSQLPVVTAFTCVVGQYGLPGYDSLSETLIRQAGAGAIGIWSPTADEDDAESVELGRFFMENLFSGPGTVLLGDAVRATLAAARATLPVSTLRVYNLLGDPALKLQLQWEAVVPGGGGGFR